MSRSLKSLILFVFMFFQAAVSHGHIYGIDRRTPTQDFKGPLAFLGKVYWSNGKIGFGKCTAALIGPDLVLTAGHCIDSAAFTDIYFVLNYNHADFRARSQIIAEYLPKAQGRNYDPENDYAILRLAEPLGKSVGWFKIYGGKLKPKSLFRRIEENYYDNWSEPIFEVNMAGYPGDIKNGEEPSVEKNCGIHDYIDDHYTFDCGLFEGGSGSPIFYKGSDDFYYILGLARADYTSVTNKPYLPQFTADTANKAVPSFKISNYLRNR